MPEKFFLKPNPPVSVKISTFSKSFNNIKPGVWDPSGGILETGVRGPLPHYNAHFDIRMIRTGSGVAVIGSV